MYNYAWSLAMTIGLIVALVLLWDDPGSTSFVLTAIGIGIASSVWRHPPTRGSWLGTPGSPRRLGGGTANVLRDQLGPTCDDVDCIRALPGGL